jgi:hypothetical protein
LEFSFEIGEPSKLEYGPSSLAISIEAVTAQSTCFQKFGLNFLASSLVKGKRNDKSIC